MKRAFLEVSRMASALRAHDASFDEWLDLSPCDRTVDPPGGGDTSQHPLPATTDDTEEMATAPPDMTVDDFHIRTVAPDEFFNDAHEDGTNCYMIHTTWTTPGSTQDTQLPAKYADFADVFDEAAASRLPEHRAFDCAIDLHTGKEPPFGRLYGLSPREQEAMKVYLTTNLESGFIRPSKSPAGAPVLFAKKKDGSLRFCVDYRGLNADHERHVRLVLERLREAKLFGKLSKCAFDASEVEFLGYVISHNGVRIDQARIDTILAWEPPGDAHAVRVFLGFANFYRKFIAHYGEIVLPLTDLTKDNVDFHWGAEEDAAFRTLKAAFTSPPILTHFNPDRPCEVETDASDFALAMVLSQRDDDGELHPIAFYSRKLTPEEINYKMHDKELLPIVEGFQKWRQFLDSAQHQTLVYSDHRNLQWFLSSQKLSRRQVRWAQLLGEFDFRIAHRPGRLHGKPDALTRRPEYRPTKAEAEAAQQATQVLTAAHFITTDSPVTNHVLNLIGEPRSTESLWARIRTNQATDPFVQKADGILYRDDRVVVSGDDCKLEILKSLHDAQTAGHFGLGKTLHLVLREFWWPGLRDYVKHYIKSCDVCCRSKTPRHKPSGLLMPLPLPTQLWSSISMDFIMAHFIPCKETTTAEQLADLFLSNVFRLHGLPDDVTSDRGPQFVSKFWRQLLDRLGTRRNLSSARHPESDGQTERVNQVLEQYLRCYVNYQQDDWAQRLPIAEFAYNTASHSATGDLVMLRKGALQTGRPCDKLDVTMLGPYKVTKVVNKVAFELALPATCRMHNVFHSSLLEPYVPSVIPGRQPAPPDPIVLEGEDAPLYVVNDILDSRFRNGRLFYFLDWDGYPASERTWEPATSLRGTGGLDRAIAEFHRRYPDKPGPGRRRARNRPNLM
ncbi:hypothetical protein PBRA_009599 [Plasmodiophora brassicae]|uniref:Integrase catalytic domain-containing protein n=1 Tax=Plasmodiophora brassicae TaxID=37360 RepID=A0A0G4IJ07_PLABS|nr:hypothetical protein PBRA_009599 [Plasmodiophora brassicae]